MGKFFDKIASALGFSRNYDEYEEYDEYDEYDQYDQYDQYDEEPVKETKSSRFGSSKSDHRYESSRYEEPEYDYGYEETGYSKKDYTRSSYSGSASSSYARNRNSKVVNLNPNAEMKVVVSNPETIEEAKEIAQSLKERRPVVVNLEFVDQPIAQRITDFLCGCCYALNGNIKRIADRIFMIVPDNVGFSGDDISDRLKDDGLSFTWQED